LPVRRESVPCPVTLNQPLASRFTDTRHLPVDLTSIRRLSDNALGPQLLDGEIVSVGRACLTLIVLVGAPRAEMVIVPVRSLDVLFDLTRILKRPLPVRREFVPCPLTLNQPLASRFTDTRQLPVDVTSIRRLPEKALVFQLLRGEIVSVGRACLTLIVLVGPLGALTVTVPEREELDEFAVTDITNRFLSSLLALNQVRFVLTLQLPTFDVTRISLLLDLADGLHVPRGETVSVTLPACFTVIRLVGPFGALTVTVPEREDADELAETDITN